MTMSTDEKLTETLERLAARATTPTDGRSRVGRRLRARRNRRRTTFGIAAAVSVLGVSVAFANMGEEGDTRNATVASTGEDFTAPPSTDAHVPGETVYTVDELSLAHASDLILVSDDFVVQKSAGGNGLDSIGADRLLLFATPGLDEGDDGYRHIGITISESGDYPNGLSTTGPAIHSREGQTEEVTLDNGTVATFTANADFEVAAVAWHPDADMMITLASVGVDRAELLAVASSLELSPDYPRCLNREGDSACTVNTEPSGENKVFDEPPVPSPASP